MRTPACHSPQTRRSVRLLTVVDLRRKRTIVDILRRHRTTVNTAHPRLRLLEKQLDKQPIALILDLRYRSRKQVLPTCPGVTAL
jgi:hypothetical protein